MKKYSEITKVYSKHLSVSGKNYIFLKVDARWHNTPIKRITPSMIRSWLATFEASSMRKAALKSFRASWNYALNRGVINISDPSHGLRVEHHSKSYARALSGDQYKEIFRRLDDSIETAHNPFVYLAIKVCALTGLRISEVLGLNLVDYSDRLVGDELKIEHHKTEKISATPKIIYLTDSIIDVLDYTVTINLKYREKNSVRQQHTAALFLSLDNHGTLGTKPVTYSTVRTAFKALIADIDPTLTLHNLRSAFISTAVSKGLTAEQISAVTGQSVGVIERHYIRHLKTNAKKYAALISDSIQPG